MNFKCPSLGFSAIGAGGRPRGQQKFCSLDVDEEKHLSECFVIFPYLPPSLWKFNKRCFSCNNVLIFALLKGAKKLAISLKVEDWKTYPHDLVKYSSLFNCNPKFRADEKI